MDKKPIYIVPIGKVERDLLNFLCRRLEEIFPFPCKVGKSLPEPFYAYDRNRNQYNSRLILNKMETEFFDEAEKVLGVANFDLYTPGLNFVFGLACLRGKYGIIALPRLRQSFYGLPEDEDLYLSRVTKEAVHELGHTFGLDHCKDKECVMYFSNSLRDTDYKGENFCKKCYRKLPFRR